MAVDSTPDILVAEPPDQAHQRFGLIDVGHGFDGQRREVWSGSSRSRSASMVLRHRQYASARLHAMTPGSVSRGPGWSARPGGRSIAPR